MLKDTCPLMVLLAHAIFCQAEEVPTSEQVYQRVSPSILTLEVQTPDGSSKLGSAFLAVKDGLAVTAWHVVNNAQRIRAKFSNGEAFEVSGLVDKDVARDIAVIRIKASGRPLLPLSPTNVQVGSRSYVVGAPKGYEFSISDGLVSQIQDVNGFRQYQFSCPTSPGNRGGPLLNSKGIVIGVVSWTRNDAQNSNFATPSVYVLGLDASLPTTPWIQTGQATDESEPVVINGPPRIVSTAPAVGATEVDPGITEIRVTFDRDMSAESSWTGRGPDYPPIPEGQKPQWRDKRTCILPVKLQAAHYYCVGLNSTSYRNFRSADGVVARPSAIYFATKGASEEIKQKVRKPQVVALTPINGAKGVDPNLTELRVTFSVPMGGGFSWTGGGTQYPTIPKGKRPFWTPDKKTCVLPVNLQAGKEYRLGLNSPSQWNFQSASGVPLDPVSYTFTTRQ